MKQAMKRIKKQGGATYGQLCLFETPPPPAAAEGETYETQKEARRDFKNRSPYPCTTPPVEALKQEGNALKTEISNGRELNHLWRANPRALHTLNQMAKKNPAVLTLVRRLGLVPLCLLLLLACTTPPGRKTGTKADSESKNAPASTLQQAVSLLAVLEGWHDPQKTDCTGWGHRVCYDGTRVTTPTEADSLAAADLRALSARFRDFQGDSLLLALLAYNVGVKAVKTSSLMDSLSFDAYTSFCYIKGRRSERQYQRRRAEWMLFKTL